MPMFPYGLLSVAAYLDSLKKYKVILANLSKAGFKKGAALVCAKKPDVVGVSVFSFNRAVSAELIKEIKRLMPGVKLFAGGPMPHFWQMKCLSGFAARFRRSRNDGEKFHYTIR